MGKQKNKPKANGLTTEHPTMGNGLPGTKTKTSKSARKGIRLPIAKTYKLYIGGKFPRSESGRYLKLKDKEGDLLANVSRGSRKDFRMAVVSARAAQKKWAARSAYNRGQIVYRIAEMLEWRKAQFIEELISMGSGKKSARREVDQSIDRLVYYAGWADKYQQIFSSVNPTASSHFNFSVLESMGVISIFAPEENGLLGLISVVIPSIVGGNTCIVLASSQFPTCSISFAEVLHTSDMPGGVINILTGSRNELLNHFSTHKDVNAMVYCGKSESDLQTIKQNSTQNLKRVVAYDRKWSSAKSQGPYYIIDTQEVKTTWHPIGT